MADMEPDEIKRRVIETRGGVGGKLETRWFDTHDGQPEIVDVGETPYRDTTVYIPELPLVPPYLMTNADDSPVTVKTVTLSIRESRTRVSIVERTEVDVSDPFHPIIKLYGYERIYRARVWVTDDEANTIDRRLGE